LSRDTQFLQRSHNTWKVVVEVPKHLRARAGRTRFKKSLQTDSLAEANSRKHAYVAEFKRQIALLEKAQTDPHSEVRLKVRAAVVPLQNWCWTSVLLSMMEKKRKTKKHAEAVLYGMPPADSWNSAERLF
jgi:hypothetical protein